MYYSLLFYYVAGNKHPADGDGGRRPLPRHEVREPDAAAHQQDPDGPSSGDSQANQAVHHHR